MEDKELIRLKISELNNKKRQEIMKSSQSRSKAIENIRDINQKIRDLQNKTHG